MKYHFGKSFLEDLEHKMWIVHDEPDLLEDYSLTKEQVFGFLRQFKGKQSCHETKEIDIPDFLLPCVKEEMENMADIAWGNAKSEGIKAIGYATAIERQLEKIK